MFLEEFKSEILEPETTSTKLYEIPIDNSSLKVAESQ